MQKRGLAALLAIVCAVVAFFVGPVLGFFLGVAAVLLGLIGFVRAASPRVSGGIISLLAIALGIVAVIVKIIHGALALLF